MTKSIVYFDRKITPTSLVQIYQKLNITLPGKVGVKISTGEIGGHNFLQPKLIKDLIKHVNGTIVECNTAYEGARNTTNKHLKTATLHGFTSIAPVDILDAEGELELPVKAGNLLDVDIVGEGIKKYDSFINLAHFKGHQMAGFGGVIKNQAIGFASSVGKAYIHTAGKSRDLEKFLHCFDSEESMAELLPTQNNFLEAIAEATTAIVDYLNTKGSHRLTYINVANNLSVDCDCSKEPETPCMQDIGILASLDPVALDQATLDLIYQSDDPGRDHFVQRVEEQNGKYILEYAEKLGLGTRQYEIIETSTC